MCWRSPSSGCSVRARLHGYELRKRLATLFGTFRAFSYGSLYPTLRRSPRRAGSRRTNRSRPHRPVAAGQACLPADRGGQGTLRGTAEPGRTGGLRRRGLRRRLAFFAQTRSEIRLQIVARSRVVAVDGLPAALRGASPRCFDATGDLQIWSRISDRVWAKNARRAPKPSSSKASGPTWSSSSAKCSLPPRSAGGHACPAATRAMPASSGSSPRSSRLGEPAQGRYRPVGERRGRCRTGSRVACEARILHRLSLSNPRTAISTRSTTPNTRYCSDVAPYCAAMYHDDTSGRGKCDARMPDGRTRVSDGDGPVPGLSPRADRSAVPPPVPNASTSVRACGGPRRTAR